MSMTTCQVEEKNLFGSFLALIKEDFFSLVIMQNVANMIYLNK